MKVKWWERFLVEWAAFVMDADAFDSFLTKYGFEIDDRLQVIRATSRR